MSTFLVFTLLGLGVGAMYALSAYSVVLVFRSSGVINLSAGSSGMVGAYAWWEASTHGLPTAAAVACGVVASGAVGAVTFFLAIRPLRGASTLAKLVSTLGVLIVLQALATLIFGSDSKATNTILPTGVVGSQGLLIPVSDLYLIGISLVLTAAVWAFYRWTKFGLATSALAQSPVGLASLGYRSDVLGCVNWALGGILAGLAGIFLASQSPISPNLGTALIVPVLASAVVGQMSSFPIVGLGAFVIGALQSDLGNYVNVPGIGDVVPLAIVAILLIVRGQSLPLRSFSAERLPRVQRAQLPLGRILLAAVIAALIVALWLPVPWVLATTTTCCATLVLLSVVVVTGYGGQISLAQFALAGVGGLAAAQAISAGVPLLVGLALALLAVLPISILVGLPAARTRGMALAIATLALAQVLVGTVLNNTNLIGGYDGITPGRLSIFGLDVTPATYPRRYSIFAIVVLALTSVLVCNLRRGHTGRRLLAVRGNERAAAAVGINVVTTKLGAFAYGGLVAALGGSLFVLQNSVATFSYFDVFSSVQYVAWAVIGGVGYVAGALLGAGFQQGSLGSHAFNSIFGSAYFNYLTLAAGILVIVNLAQSANGLVPINVHLYQAARLRLSPRRRVQANGSGSRGPAPSVDAATLAPTTPERTGATHLLPQEAGPPQSHHLTVTDLRVDLGGVRALDSVSFELRTGQVLGVIGPNGAGKTTLIDAITGFVKVGAGRIELDGREVTRWTPQRRARAGVARSFQSLELFDQLTVRENLLAASTRGRVTDWVTDLVWPSRAGLPAAAERVLRVLSLQADVERVPDELSFGARRGVAVARAVAAGAWIVLLDEPAAGLDHHEREQLCQVITWLAKELGVAVLLIEHDVALVKKVSDQVLALDRGVGLRVGDPHEVLADRRVLESYIGAESGDDEGRSQEAGLAAHGLDEAELDALA